MENKKTSEVEAADGSQLSMVSSVSPLESQESGAEETELSNVIPIRSVTRIVNGIRETTVLDIPTIPTSAPITPQSESLEPFTPPSSSGLISQEIKPPPSSPPTEANQTLKTKNDEIHRNGTINAEARKQLKSGRPASLPNPHFLEVYWNWIKFPEATGNEGSNTVLLLLWKVCWILLTVLTTFDTFTNIKDSLLDINHDKQNADLTHAKLVRLAYRIAQLVLKVAYILAATKKPCVTTKAFKHLDPSKSPNMACVPAIVVTTTIAVSLACVLGGLGVVEVDQSWSFHQITHHHFENTYDRILVWHPSHNEHETDSDFLFYGGAALGYMMHFASRLVELSIQSLLLLTTLSFLFEVKEASGDIQSFNVQLQRPNQEEGVTERLTDLGEKIMAEYENQRDLTKDMNAAFGMFSFIHCTNLTLLVFWGHSAYTEFDIGEFIWAGIEVWMFGTSYFVAIYVAIMASGYEDWILNTRTQEVMKINCARLQTLLHEMKNSPIGIGSGILYVNKDFIVKFAVLSFQAFMVLLRALANHST